MSFKEFNDDITQLIQGSLSQDRHVENTIEIYRFVYENVEIVLNNLLEEEVPACIELVDLLSKNSDDLIKKYSYIVQNDHKTRVDIHTAIYWLKMTQKTLKKVNIRLGFKVKHQDQGDDGPGPYDDIAGRGNSTVFICTNCYDGYDEYDN